jgi:hypothetical protein
MKIESPWTLDTKLLVTQPLEIPEMDSESLLDGGEWPHHTPPPMTPSNVDNVQCAGNTNPRNIVTPTDLCNKPADDSLTRVAGCVVTDEPQARREFESVVVRQSPNHRLPIACGIVPRSHVDEIDEHLRLRSQDLQPTLPHTQPQAHTHTRGILSR